MSMTPYKTNKNVTESIWNFEVSNIEQLTVIL